MSVTGCRCEKPARATLLAFALICAAAGACSQDTDPGPAITSEGGNIFPPVFAWSGDDSEIVFAACCQSDTESLKALRISDRKERTLDSGKYYLAATSQPRSDLFFVADVGWSRRVLDRRLFAASSGRELASLQESSAFVVAPDALRIAFTRSQSDASGVFNSPQTFIVDVTSGGSTELVNCRMPRHFSPDGSRIVCDAPVEQSADPRAVRPAIVDIASGMATALPETFEYADVAWTSSGLRAVYQSDTNPGQAVVEDAATGQRTILSDEDTPGVIFVADNFSQIPPTWSRDGTRVAFWKVQCHESVPAELCSPESYPPGTVHARLVVHDVAHGTSRVVAVGEYRGSFAFSNDGHKIAYWLDGALRMRDVD
jgi:Tol biopolymer transport system component